MSAVKFKVEYAPFLILAGLAAALLMAGCPSLFEVTVPDVVNATGANAQAAIIGTGLVIGTVTYESSTTVAPGNVISQDPKAGVSITSSSPVNLVISTGPQQTVVVPSVVGLSQAAANALLIPAGLIPGTVTKQYSPTVPAGLVISQDPAAGTSISSGTAVNLVLSMGPQPVPVPNVVGDTEANAQAAILAAGLVVGTSTEQYSPTGDIGDVCKQTPAAGANVAPGSTVNLVISKGNSETFLVNNVSVEMVLLPGGSFNMGSPNTDTDASSYEMPQHQATLTHNFWLAKYVVTKVLWQAVMGTNPWAGQGNVVDDSQSPAVYVSWQDVAGLGGFLDAANAASGLALRLPTEAEWECACRAGTTTRFYWGDDPGYTLIDGYAWCAGGAGQPYAPKAGLKPANPWGLFDMSGNVWEWCGDWWDTYPISPVVDPIGGQAGTYRVARGGSWNDLAEDCRSAARNRFTPDSKNATVGFRLAMTGP